MNNVNRLTLFLLVFVVFCGILVLAGWHWDISTFKTILPGFIAMKANTAIGLIGLALSALFLSREKSFIAQIVGMTLALFVCFLSVLTLSEYLFNVDFKIDELLFLDPEGRKLRWPPGRFAPITGINFLFIGTALIFHSINKTGFVKFTQALVTIAWIASLQGFIGYVSGNSYAFGSAFYTQLALHTSILFIALTSAILLDLFMPVMNGREFLDAIEESKNVGLKNIPIILITASEPSAREDLDTRTAAVMRKPLDLKAFLSLLKTMSDPKEEFSQSQ